MKTEPVLWFNNLDPTAQYFGAEPSFLAVDHYPEVRAIQETLPELYEELQQYLQHFEMDPYFNTTLVDRDADWKTIGLKVWGIPLFYKRRHFPKTSKLLKQHGRILTFSFNKLEPQSRIKPHCGDCNGTIRIHIGLEIPAGLPDCGFRVKNQESAWRYKEAFGFIDAFEHEAWNNTVYPRYIILLDIIRPEFKKMTFYVCFRVLMSLFLQKVVSVFPFLLKSPNWLKQGVFVVLALPQKIMSLFRKKE